MRAGEPGARAPVLVGRASAGRGGLGLGEVGKGQGVGPGPKEGFEARDFETLRDFEVELVEFKYNFEILLQAENRMLHIIYKVLGNRSVLVNRGDAVYSFFRTRSSIC